MDLKETAILGADIERHWYYSAKAKAMTRMLGQFAPRTILDVGAGSGFFSRHLLGSTAAHEAWCVDTSYEAERSSRASGKPIHFRRSIGTIEADLVLMMDVLEHVDNDVALLRDYVAKVPDETAFMITVPAFQFLWSDHDEFLEHKRRYKLKQLEATVIEAGLEIRQGAYFFGAVFPIAATLRLAQRLFGRRRPARSQLTTHSALANLTLKILCTLELPILRLNRVAGLTAFCLAVKPRQATGSNALPLSGNR